MKVINRKARFEYEILEKFELGIVLYSGEVKSIRKGQVNINDAYIGYSEPHLMIYNMHVAEYKSIFLKTYEPNRSRIMLVHKRERNKMLAAVNKKGYTVVPLELYWNKRGFAKLLCAIAQGKALYDKRAAIKEREWNREKEAANKYRKMVK